MPDPLDGRLRSVHEDFPDIVGNRPILHKHGTGPASYAIQGRLQRGTALRAFVSCASPGTFRVDVAGNFFDGDCIASPDASALIPVKKTLAKSSAAITVDQTTEYWVVVYRAVAH